MATSDSDFVLLWGTHGAAVVIGAVGPARDRVSMHRMVPVIPREPVGRASFKCIANITTELSLYGLQVGALTDGVVQKRQKIKTIT